MSADKAALIGWMIDVRGNGGGNMWPMIAGVGPVLGEGVAGYFIDPVGVETAWEYRDGAAWEGGVANQRVAAPYRLRRDRPRVAVLTDNGIASSGEAVVISFRGRPDTRSFGDHTCGLSTRQRAVSDERRSDAEHHGGGHGRPDTNEVRLLHSTGRERADGSGRRAGGCLAADRDVIPSGVATTLLLLGVGLVGLGARRWPRKVIAAVTMLASAACPFSP